MLYCYHELLLSGDFLSLLGCRVFLGWRCILFSSPLRWKLTEAPFFPIRTRVTEARFIQTPKMHLAITEGMFWGDSQPCCNIERLNFSTLPSLQERPVTAESESLRVMQAPLTWVCRSEIFSGRHSLGLLLGVLAEWMAFCNVRRSGPSELGT